MDRDELIVKITRLCDKWDGIRTRVRDPHYVARGIGVCKEWVTSGGRQRFIRWSLENGFELGLDLDRIDNDLGYFPENCRWVTRSTNMRNTSKSKTLMWKGQLINMKSLSETRDCKVPYYLLKARLANGWPLEEAMTRPPTYSCGWARGTRKRRGAAA